VLLAMRQILFDRRFERTHIFKGASTNPLSRDVRKKRST
jgi:hypothetical protein